MALLTSHDAARRARERFLSFFPDGFRDDVYIETERSPKWLAHRQWQEELGRTQLRSLLQRRRFRAIADEAVRIESRWHLLFSFEKMALRDAVRSPRGAQHFAEGLYAWLYGPGPQHDKFDQWRDTIAALPRRQTRVLTWPILTVFGFIAHPRRHMYLKPTVTRRAASAYGFPFPYSSRPQWETYKSVLDFARQVRDDIADMRPRDMIDIQGFIWVLGSEEYD
jgi:hypothetical protein